MLLSNFKDFVNVTYNEVDLVGEGGEFGVSVRKIAKFTYAINVLRD